MAATVVDHLALHPSKVQVRVRSSRLVRRLVGSHPPDTVGSLVGVERLQTPAKQMVGAHPLAMPDHRRFDSVSNRRATVGINFSMIYLAGGVLVQACSVGLANAYNWGATSTSSEPF